MVRATTHRGSLWELAVLSLLREEPMHPYQMQRLLVERHKDEVLALRRGSLYHAINRLTQQGLILAVKVGREGRRPERTVYRITAAGDRERMRWLRDRIATPQQEPLEFVASLNFLVYLSAEDAVVQLEARIQALTARARTLHHMLKGLAGIVDRINRIESEYLLAVTEAELAWVRRLAGEVRSGSLAWDLRSILEKARAARKTARRGGGSDEQDALAGTRRPAAKSRTDRRVAPALADDR
jgi:DNA-binding PadR family transcriptional regulator